MSNLTEQQIAMMSIADTRGRPDPGLPCAVVAVSRAQVALYPLEDLHFEYLPVSIGEVYLSFTHGKGVAALRGVAQAIADDDVRFCPLDTVQLSRRRSSRLRMAAEVDLAPFRGRGGFQSVHTRSVDISASGLLLARRGAFDVGELVTFELEVEPADDPVSGVARVLRSTRDLVALDFKDVAPAERRRLDDHIIAAKRRELEAQIGAHAAREQIRARTLSDLAARRGRSAGIGIDEPAITPPVPDSVVRLAAARIGTAR